MQTLPGFRDFFPEEHTRLRCVLDTWRQTARGYGFVEYDAPTLEASALYEKKNSGGEILEQLYRFEDRGGRDVALRPEMTPSLARMVAARATRYRKPLKWFSIARFFRYERQQRGRLREFLQFNCDLIGDSSTGADAEMIALTIDTLRAFGLGAPDFTVRLSDRGAWGDFLARRNIPAERAGEFLLAVDRMEREPPESLRARLDGFGVRAEDLREFIAGGAKDFFGPLLDDLDARGLLEFVEPDLGIVRGLAYYTGVVFEVFDRQKTLRAVAGGGRYDHLISSLSDGAADLPAVGMGMGDVVLGHLLEKSPAAAERLERAAAADSPCEIFVVVAEEGRRREALGIVQQLRSTGRRVDFSPGPCKVGKQFQCAEAGGARFAVLVGAEWPAVKIKDMAARTEREMGKDALADWARNAQF